MSLFEREKKIVDDIMEDYKVGKVDLFGNKVGEWKHYRKDNTLESIQTYGDVNMPFKYYYKNGNLYQEGTFVSKETTDFGNPISIRVGECKLYYETGELHTIYHNKVVQNPNLYSETRYLSLMDGPLTSYYSTGEVLRTCNMRNDEIEGPYIIYNKDGSIGRKEIYKKREQTDGEIKYGRSIDRGRAFSDVYSIMEISKHWQ